MATADVSSVKSQKLSNGVTTALASALSEWLLIFFLFIDAVFSYIITKFACYSKLQIPCLFCSRLDHVLGKKEQGYYWDLICSNHKLEISSLVLCRAHNKLVNVHGICEICLISFATINKSNAETYRLLVGKLGEKSDSRFDEDPLLSGHGDSFSTTKHCSCCNKPWVLKRNDQRLVLSKSIGSDAAELDILSSSAVVTNFHKRRTRPSISLRARRLRNRLSDPLSHVGYTELKITSDTESEVAISEDDDATSTPVNHMDDTNEDVEVQCVQMEPRVIKLDEDLDSEKLVSSASPIEQSGIQLEHTDIPIIKPRAATTEALHGLEELNWQQAERIDVCHSPSELVSFDDVPPSSSNTDPVEALKEANDLVAGEVRLTSEQRCTSTKCEEIIKSASKQTTSEAALEPTPISSDIGQQNPSSLDLGDAYKLAVSNKGRQLSGLWLGKDSSRISEDLKILLSQLSSRGSELSVSDMSPRLSVNMDEMKTSDASNSTGMQLLQRRISLERNESGLSLDGSIVSEIEGESTVDRLKRQVDHDRKIMSALYKELEEERSASAVAANQALAMITRLQEEKAALHMEALQYFRMMDEQSEYDIDAVQKANDLVAEKEEEIEALEAELELFRKKFPTESALETLVETNSDMKVIDIGLDHSQRTCIESDEMIPRSSDTSKPNVSDEVDEKPMALEEKNFEPVKSPVLNFEDERSYILQRLNKLEKQVYHFLNIHEKSINSENERTNHSERELEENYIKQVNIPSMQDNVFMSQKPQCGKANGEHECDGHSFPVLCSGGDLKSVSVGSLISDLNGRLQALEADRSFLEHAINVLRNGEDGLKLLEEIANHLQELRRIGIREVD